MIDERAADRYARSLFGLALEEGTLEETDRLLAGVRDILSQNPAVTHLEVNPTLSREIKEDLIERLVPDTVSPLLRNFLKVLARKNRFKILPAVQKRFRILFEKSRGIIQVEAVTARPLGKTLAGRLLEILTTKLRAKIRLIEKVDPAILGGLILRFEGKEIDSSYQYRFEELRRNLVLS